MAYRYGIPKNRVKKIRRSDLWEARLGAKNTEMFHFFCRFVFFLWPPTEMSHFCRWAHKNTDRPTELYLPLSTKCAQGGPHFQISNKLAHVVVVVVFTLKTVLTSIQYPSLSYSSRQRNEFPWSHANPK